MVRTTVRLQQNDVHHFCEHKVSVANVPFNWFTAWDGCWGCGWFGHRRLSKMVCFERMLFEVCWRLLDCRDEIYESEDLQKKLQTRIWFDPAAVHDHIFGKFVHFSLFGVDVAANCALNFWQTSFVPTKYRNFLYMLPRGSKLSGIGNDYRCDKWINFLYATNYRYKVLKKNCSLEYSILSINHCSITEDIRFPRVLPGCLVVAHLSFQ